MARRRRNPSPTPPSSTPEGIALGLGATAGLLASFYYVVTAVGTSMNAQESRRRSLLAGGLLVGTVSVVTLLGEASARRRGVPT